MRVDLAGGHWADVKDELTTGEIERITNAAQVWDDAAGQWKTNGMTAAIEACDFIVVEWSVPGGAEPSAEAVRALPSAIGRALASAISTHVLAARTLPRGFRRRELDLAVAVRRDGSPHLAEDWDLLLADRFGVDPWVVRERWPASLVGRALSRIDAEAKHGKKG